MRLADREQTKLIEKLSVQEFEISEELLMESAGIVAARELEQAFYPELNNGHLAVVCGSGNNAGDALVMARHLYSAGYRDLSVFYFAPLEQRSELFKTQLKRCQLQGLKLFDLSVDFNLIEKIKSCSLIVDGIFGIGLNREIKGEFAKIIELLNQSKKPIVSLDIPSGLDCDTGRVLGICVKAQMTFSFAHAKPGFFIGEASSLTGRLRILPIGVPYELTRKLANQYFLFTEKLAKRYLPKRTRLSHKADYGHCLVLAGRSSYWGAAVLSSMSAYRVGAGYVSLASFDQAQKIVVEIPEVLIEPKITIELLKAKKYNSIVVGPGLGVGPQTAELIKNLKNLNFQNVVIDADAITTCAQENLFPLPSQWVMTPHAGELSRVLGVSSEEIQRDRLKYSKMAAEKTGCLVLLKGYRSILADTSRAMIVMSGNSALAKAGTGDVLAGMIGGLMAQGIPNVQATSTAAYLHGRLADEWVQMGYDKRSLVASDLQQMLPSLIHRLSTGALG